MTTEAIEANDNEAGERWLDRFGTELEQRAYCAGQSDGYATGFSNGHRIGVERTHDIAYSHGRQAGFSEGHLKGFGDAMYLISWCQRNPETHAEPPGPTPPAA